MNHRKNEPHYRAGHMKLEGGIDSITRMCSTGDFLEIYKVDRTFRIHKPKSMDVCENDPNMPWMSQQIANVGSANEMIDIAPKVK
jgi:hypothetical protein